MGVSPLYARTTVGSKGVRTPLLPLCRVGVAAHFVSALDYASHAIHRVLVYFHAASLGVAWCCPKLISMGFSVFGTVPEVPRVTMSVSV